MLAVSATIACGTSAYAVRISHPPAALASWLIPPDELPHDAATIDARAESLVQRYPSDPRSFEFVGALRPVSVLLQGRRSRLCTLFSRFVPRRPNR